MVLRGNDSVRRVCFSGHFDLFMKHLIWIEEETVFWKFLVVFSLQYCLSLCWLWIIWTFVPFPNRKFSKSTMTEANCGRIKKERLDWDFLQALVKMNTAVNPTLPVILPFSSVCHRTGLVQVREPPKNLVYLFSFDTKAHIGHLMSTQRKQLDSWG